MRKRVYEAFTLVEMLVVMGILIILMVVGIVAGRFALFRAADVAHRNGAEQLFEGLQAYFVDHRAFPKAKECGAGKNDFCSPKALLDKANGPLTPYIDEGAFVGGSGATYYYFAGGDNYDQAALICVTMRGLYQANMDHNQGAYYCAGNAFSVPTQPALVTGSGEDEMSFNVNQNLVEKGDPLWDAFISVSRENASDWDDNVWK